MPNPLEAIKYILQNPQEALGMAGQMATQDYNVMPDMQLSDQSAGGWPSPQSMYNFAQDMTSFNPAMEAGGAVAGMPFVGRMARPLTRMLGRYGDEAAQYMGRMKPAGGGGAAALGPDLPLPNRGPTTGGPGGLAGQEIASGHPTLPMNPQPAVNDFAGIQPLDVPPGPSPNPYMQQAPTPNPYGQVVDDVGAGMQYRDMSPGQAAAHPDFPAGMPQITGDIQLDGQIMQAADQFMAQGFDPESAIEAAVMQFSYLLR